MVLANINVCETIGCGEIFRTYFCKKCSQYEKHYCKFCHNEHFNEINRMKNLSRLKRGIDNV